MLRRLRTLTPVCGSAVLVALAFPPLRIRALAWVALVPFLIALHGTRLRTAVALGGLWGVCLAYAVGQWLPRAVANYYQQPALLGFVFFLGVALTMVAPYTIAFAVGARALLRRTAATTPLFIAMAWAAAELARGRLFTGSLFFIGNPWALLGYSQVGWGPLIQIADATGIYGVSFVLAVVNAALAQLWLHPGRAARRGVGVAAICVLAAWTYGHHALSLAGDAPAAATPVAVVQANLDLGPQWDASFYGRNLDVYLRYTHEAIAAHRPALVFWPEGTMTFFLEEGALYRTAIARALQPGNVELVAGGPRAVGRDAPRYYNSVFLVAPDGTLRGHYDKQYLVPFTEYFPIAGIDFLRRRFERVRVFSPGEATPPLPTVAGPAGIVTCNEAMLPEIVAQRVAEGAAYLVNPSNDSWLADRTYSELQFDIVTARAVEQRRYLVRASTSGPSAIVDPWGRVQVRTAPLTSGVVAGTIRQQTERTLYGRIGDAFGVACALGALAGILAQRRGT